MGEGFASLRGANNSVRFKSAASVERDENSHGTLLLRHFVRAFSNGELPADYYRYLEGEITLSALYELHPEEYHHASQTALRISLGPETHATVKKTIGERVKDTQRWALVGGPPCQAYSLVGRSRMINDPKFAKDERHFLYREYLKIIVDHRPPIFVMENVKGLLSAKTDGSSMISLIISDLTNPTAAVKDETDGLSYRLYSLVEEDQADPGVDPRLFLVRAENFGVPQARHRMFIVGIRSDLKVRPALLQPHDAPSVRDMIGDLPVIRSTLSRGQDTPSKWREAVTSLKVRSVVAHLNGSEYTQAVRGEILTLTAGASWPYETSSTEYSRKRGHSSKALSSIYDPELHTLLGHEARGHMSSDIGRYFYAAIFAQVTGKSPKLADFPDDLLPEHANVDLGVSGDMFSDRFRVQLPDQVSTTITSHISKDGHYFIHYDPVQSRSLTVREAARLQTFPDNYAFLGPRTSQYHQVGNAVPPYLARQIAEIVADVLDSMTGEA